VLRRELADYMLSTAVPVDPRLPPESLLPQIERAIDTMGPAEITAMQTEMRMKRRADSQHTFDYDPCESR
jgi:hypothetical protein